MSDKKYKRQKFVAHMQNAITKLFDAEDELLKAARLLRDNEILLNYFRGLIADLRDLKRRAVDIMLNFEHQL